VAPWVCPRFILVTRQLPRPPHPQMKEGAGSVLEAASETPPPNDQQEAARQGERLQQQEGGAVEDVWAENERELERMSLGRA